jgi:nucleotide-binding universal stress UspA family protein
MNILLAIDHSPCSAAAVQAVRDRYRTEHSTVRILHVVEWPHDLPSALAFAEGPRAAASVVAAHDQLRQSGDGLVAHAARELRAAGFEVATFVVDGEPRRIILEMAAAWPAETIVLGSHGRRGFDRLFLGSVSESVLRHALCSVAVIREPRAHHGADHISMAS